MKGKSAAERSGEQRHRWRGKRRRALNGVGRYSVRLKGDFRGAKWSGGGEGRARRERCSRPTADRRTEAKRTHQTPDCRSGSGAALRDLWRLAPQRTSNHGESAGRVHRAPSDGRPATARAPPPNSGANGDEAGSMPRHGGGSSRSTEQNALITGRKRACECCGRRGIDAAGCRQSAQSQSRPRDTSMAQSLRESLGLQRFYDFRAVELI